MRKNFLILMLLALLPLSSFAVGTINGTVQENGKGLKFKILSVYAVPTEVNRNTVEVSQADWVANAEDKTSLVIPSTVSFAVVGTDDSATPVNIDKTLTFDVVAVSDEGFKGLTDLTSVTFPASIEAIGDEAFAGCYSLEALNFASGSKLTTIGDKAFSAWIKPTFDLSAATSLTTLPDNLLMTAAAAAANGNTYITEVKLPASLTTLGTALANLPNLAKVNIKDTKVAIIAADFLKNNNVITEIEFPATVATVTADAFLNAKKVAKVKFNCAYDEEGGIYYPTTINASGSNKINNVEFVGTFGGSIEDDAFLKATTVKFGDFVGTIKTGAFEDVTSFTMGKYYGAGVIQAGGVVLKNADGKPTVTFGEIAKVITTDAITGVTYNKDNRYVTLKVGKINVDASAAGTIVSAGVKEATVTGEVANKLDLDMFGSAIKVIFQGNITDANAAIEGGTAQITLKTLDFGTIEIKAGAIGATKLNAYTGITAVTWKPADAKATKAFAADAFYAATETPEPITFTTTTKVAYDAALYNWAGEGNDATLFGVKFVATAPVDKAYIEFAESQEAAPDGYYYATYFVPQAIQAAIKKVNGLTLYSVYLDGVDIYNNPLRQIDGNYYINGASAINAGLIVKSKTKDPIEVVFGDAKGKQSIQNAPYALATSPYDGLLCNNTDAAITGAQIVMEDYSFTLVDNNPVLYSALPATNNAIVKVSNPAKTKSIQYADFDPSTQPSVKIPAHGFFLFAKKVAAGAPRQIVWLDDMGNTTGIETVKAIESVNNNVIYNVAGQKVGADYKGLVIKNGKKFIQK